MESTYNGTRMQLFPLHPVIFSFLFFHLSLEKNKSQIYANRQVVAINLRISVLLQDMISIKQDSYMLYDSVSLKSDFNTIDHPR